MFSGFFEKESNNLGQNEYSIDAHLINKTVQNELQG